jgi:tRNA (guanine37-N1)-methyltransferase
MIVEIVTLFPEMFESVLKASMLGKAIESGAMQVQFTNPRDFTHDKHRTVDDTPYGGGAGMVMRPDPIVAAIEHVVGARGPAHKIALCPTGAPLTQEIVRRLAAMPRLLLLCGRYEGFDERVRPFVDEEISLGDFVLTGGELAAMTIVDAVARRLPGVLGNAESPVDESHEAGLLEYPQYTRPAQFRGAGIPEALLSGNHERIRRWRRLQALLRTRERRPDLFAKLALSDEDRALLLLHERGEEP